MGDLSDKVIRFLKSTDGPTAVEYAVLLALLIGMMVLALTYVGSATNDMADKTVNGISGALD